MSEVVIKVENLSKQYRLGTVGTGTISHDLNRFWARLRGKDDPYLRVGENNDRTRKGYSDYVWALREINFEVKQGEILGIIGRNGAGKSTLLKILSQITRPSTGSVKMKGRVGSLLEVGTGFHPDLTGRENIYINGAILGMRKREIDKKLDEIIDFAGVEKYIDTPVKRYSSGMMVRLGFSVAAHLEPEILIVDEVLAVGDAEFQKKCMGKMGAVSKEKGRTILFVSHNMGAIASLCKSGIVLSNGSLSFSGDVNEGIERYLSDKKLNEKKEISFGPLTKEEVISGKQAKITEVRIINKNIKYNDIVRIELLVASRIKIEELVIGVGIDTLTSIRLITIENLLNTLSVDSIGMRKVSLAIDNPGLSPGSYTLSVGLRQLSHDTALDYKPNIIKFTVEETLDTVQLSNKPQLGIRLQGAWEYESIKE